MRIEEGKYYRTRYGSIAGPARRCVIGGQSLWSVGPCVYNDTGRWSRFHEYPNDLIAEWTDPPSCDEDNISGVEPLVVEIGRKYRSAAGDAWIVRFYEPAYEQPWSGVRLSDGLHCTWRRDGSAADGRAQHSLVAPWHDGAPQTEAEVMREVAEAVRPENVRQAVLDAASEAVLDRGLNYGQPEQNFARIARRWRAHLLNRYGIDVQFDSASVALMMADVKAARLENDPTHRDSWVDIAGYAACGAEAAGGQG